MMPKSGEGGGRRGGSAKLQAGGGSGEPAVPATPEAALRAALASMPSRLDQREAIRRYILDHQSRDTTPVRKHEMPGPEEMRSLEFGGKTYLFADENREAAVDTILHSVTGFNKDVPEELSGHTHTIIFAAHSYRIDAANYGEFEVAATAANGQIVNYGGEAKPYSQTHEMAHNYAIDKYGSSHPPAGTDFAKAVASGEPPPTRYGGRNIAEDFAESVRMYFHNRGTLMRESPKRYAVIRRLFEDPSYGG